MEIINNQCLTTNIRWRTILFGWEFDVGCRMLDVSPFTFAASAMSAEILPTHTPGLFNAAVKRTAELLHAGEVVALPTETVYGLAANAFDARAVSRIYEIKGRPAHNPIIVHIASLETA